MRVIVWKASGEMATKSEHRVPTESTSKGVNGTVDLHAHQAGTLNGFEEVSLCQLWISIKNPGISV